MSWILSDGVTSLSLSLIPGSMELPNSRRVEAWVTKDAILGDDKYKPTPLIVTIRLEGTSEADLLNQVAALKAMCETCTVLSFIHSGDTWSRGLQGASEMTADCKFPSLVIDYKLALLPTGPFWAKNGSGSYILPG